MIKDLKSSATGEIINPNIVKDNIPDGAIDNAKLDASINAKLSEIDNKANASDVYNKTEVDNKLSLKADVSTTYTKTEVDNKLALKEDVSNKVSAFQTTPDNNHYPSEKLVKDNLDLKADASNVYSKTEVNNLLNDKADASNVYSKTEVDTKLGNKMNAVISIPTGTSSGTFTSDELLAITTGRCSVILYGTTYSELYFDTIDNITIYFKASPRVVRNGTSYDDIKQETISINNNSGAWTYTDATIESVYNKSDADALLGAKADASNVYSKTEVDNKLLDKLNKALEITGSGSGTITSAQRAYIASGITNFVKYNDEYYMLDVVVSGVYYFYKMVYLVDNVTYENISRDYIAIDTNYDTWQSGSTGVDFYTKAQVDALIPSTPHLYMHTIVINNMGYGSNVSVTIFMVLDTATPITNTNNIPYGVYPIHTSSNMYTTPGTIQYDNFKLMYINKATPSDIRRIYYDTIEFSDTTYALVGVNHSYDDISNYNCSDVVSPLD